MLSGVHAARTGPGLLPSTALDTPLVLSGPGAGGTHREPSQVFGGLRGDDVEPAVWAGDHGSRVGAPGNSNTMCSVGCHTVLGTPVRPTEVQVTTGSQASLPLRS